MQWGPVRIQAELDRIKAAECLERCFFVVGTKFMVRNTPEAYVNTKGWWGGWNDSHNEKLFERLMAALRKSNFWVAHDRDVKKRHHRIFDKYWMGAHWASRLRFRARYYPAGMEVDFYPDCNPANRNGPQYTFDGERQAAMDNWTRTAMRAAMMRLAHVCESYGLVDTTKPRFEDPRDRLEWECRECWHFKGEDSIDVPRKTESCNDTNRNGRRLRNGDLQSFRDSHGRLWRGKVYARLNNMWRMICGGSVLCMASHELTDPVPGELRKAPNRDTLSKAKRHLHRLIEEQKFERCAALRDHIAAMGVSE